MSEMLHPGDLNEIYNDFYGEYLLDAGGEWLYDRGNTNEVFTTAAITGRLNLMGFKCKRTETVGNVLTMTGTQGSVGGTIRRVGLYLRTPDRLTYNLVASTVNDLITIWNNASTEFITPFSTPYRKLRGEEYALAVLAVGGTVPNFIGPWSIAVPNSGVFKKTQNPMRGGSIDSQADLPASFLTSSIAGNALISFCSGLLP
jgi:hypothetical protein